MSSELLWDIAKYILGAVGAFLLYLYNSMNVQIKVIWKRVDELQKAEADKRVDMGVMNLQITTLTNEMSGIKEELKKLNLQTAKLDVILDMLDSKKKHGD